MSDKKRNKDVNKHKCNEIYTIHKYNIQYINTSRRGAVAKGVKHISTIVLVNIWVTRVRVQLALLVGIWICKNSTVNT